MPDLATRLPTFGQYADATLDQALGPAVHMAQRLSASTFDHVLLLNRGDRIARHERRILARRREKGQT